MEGEATLHKGSERLVLKPGDPPCRGK
ncbi:hypothetical protein ACNKHS_09670 [Shigella flexneri]